MRRGRILWVDDEIDQLKSHIHYLDMRGYEVIPVTNGDDAVELLRRKKIDLVLLDEMMPGKDGLTTLKEIQEVSPGLPVIMITKNEEETLMQQAIGSKITDYLTKPVNPSQILSACLKILDKSRISEEVVTEKYLQQFQKISQKMMGSISYQDWVEIHQQLSAFEVEFDSVNDKSLLETLINQRKECNTEFGKYIEVNYKNWLYQKYPERPILSHELIEHYVAPHLRQKKKVLFILIDGIRLDQWLTIEPLLYEFYHVRRDCYFSILPSATPYSRNTIFSGRLPLEIARSNPEIWDEIEDNDKSMNRLEEQFLNQLLTELDLQVKVKYIKVLDSEFGKSILRKISSFLNVNLISLVLNFVDILAHRRSDVDILKEIVPDEAGYRSIVRTWFGNSWLYELLTYFAERNFTIIVTSDHGSIRVLKEVKLVADRETSTNIRYKFGRNLNVAPKYAMVIKNPEEYQLPLRGVNTNYLIAKEDFYFIYPTNYHKYVRQYRDTFQHGGISLEEMIIPVVELTPRR